jgi:hypothetical protein
MEKDPMSEENKAIVAVFDVAEATIQEYDRIIDYRGGNHV